MAKLMFHRNGYYKGKLLTFTHRNPETGEVWSDDIPFTQFIGSKLVTMYGKWVPFDSVKWEKR